ncbi:MAG: hypothetical protein ACREJ0_02485, partial [Geminicoccaceae bacterium]
MSRFSCTSLADPGWDRLAVGLRYPHPVGTPKAVRSRFIGRIVNMRRLDRSLRLGLALGTLAIVLGSAVTAWHDA